MVYRNSNPREKCLPPIAKASPTNYPTTLSESGWPGMRPKMSLKEPIQQ